MIIVHISSNTFHQRKCFVFVIVCNYPGGPPVAAATRPCTYLFITQLLLHSNPETHFFFPTSFRLLPVSVRTQDCLHGIGLPVLCILLVFSFSFNFWPTVQPTVLTVALMAPCCVRLSVCRLWRIITKRCVLPKSCPKKQIGLPDRYPVLPIRTSYNPHFAQMGVLTVAPNICTANCGQTALTVMVIIDSL